LEPEVEAEFLADCCCGDDNWATGCPPFTLPDAGGLPPVLLETEFDGEPEATGAFEDRERSPAPPVERLVRECPIFDEPMLCDW